MLKWKYDKNRKYYYASTQRKFGYEASNGFEYEIGKVKGGLFLLQVFKESNFPVSELLFARLKTAKKVAQLLENR